MRLSCAVRAHWDRRHLVDGLLERLGIDNVVWDEQNSSWETGVRAWQAHDPDADWHVVIEDDAIVCRDLLAGLERGLMWVPTESAVSLYLGDRSGSRDVIKAADKRAKERSPRPWLCTPTLVWGVGLALPVTSIDGMLAWCDKLNKRYSTHVYDTRIANYYAQQLRWPAYYTWPSLVDHRGVPSLLGHGDGRCARYFIGEESSALDIDWSAQVVTLGEVG